MNAHLYVVLVDNRNTGVYVCSLYGLNGIFDLIELEEMRGVDYRLSLPITIVLNNKGIKSIKEHKAIMLYSRDLMKITDSNIPSMHEYQEPLHSSNVAQKVLKVQKEKERANVQLVLDKIEEVMVSTASFKAVFELEKLIEDVKYNKHIPENSTTEFCKSYFKSIEFYGYEVQFSDDGWGEFSTETVIFTVPQNIINKAKE